ncbi:MAG: trypsin-like peptidase domain-containing protein [Christensenellaceae bacterium]|nr:trypsin-like peptidase domain-containing protein [Christensenellaceae bacterium]
MQEKNRIRMPLGAAIACFLITALLIAGVITAGKYIGEAAEGIIDKSAIATDTPSPIDDLIPSDDQTGNSSYFPSDNLSYTGHDDSQNEKYALISNCMSAVVSIDITMQNGFTSVLAGSGSGVLVSDDGYIVTCNHVISGAEKIIVYLDSGETYEASLIGTDSITDLAVIKIDATGLPYARFGDSSTLNVGEPVFAIGNALGKLSNTYTSGSISGLDRSIEIDGQNMTLLQTDASINKGNSGGGLFRASDGALIGIVNAKSSGSGIEGLGFAIPSTLVSDIISDLMDYGFVTGRPYLGVSTQDVTMSGFGLFGSYYTYPRVTSVDDNSAAAIAGIKVNDIILSVNGESVSGSDDLYQIINSFEIGSTITITVQRGNSSVDISVTLLERTA